MCQQAVLCREMFSNCSAVRKYLVKDLQYLFHVHMVFRSVFEIDLKGLGKYISCCIITTTN
jgi:hypothetical protein